MSIDRVRDTDYAGIFFIWKFHNTSKEDPKIEKNFKHYLSKMRKLNILRITGWN